jgi:hypothetical protein
MRQTGHRSVPMVRWYIREGSLFHDNAGPKLCRDPMGWAHFFRE